MVRPKQSSSKKPKRLVDFKKIKHKIGRKLPPPRNATNTEIRSKAIVLPEQSVASEKIGLALNKKGLTLKELLQQTSHHNVRVRKDALLGIKDIAIKHPTQIKLHKLAIIMKLRERITDEDKGVRESLFQLLKSTIFPICKTDIPGAIISLLMAYIFNAMTHLSINIRLMAFKFFHLVIIHYPTSFLLQPEKVLNNYEDILRNNQLYLQDSSKLKDALSGLVHCLSLLPSNEDGVETLKKQNTEGNWTMHVFESPVCKGSLGVSSIIQRLEDLVPVLVNCFQEFTSLIRANPTVDIQSFDCILTLLQSINLIVKFLLYVVDKSSADFGCSIPSLFKGLATSEDVILLPMWLKSMFEAFPLLPSIRSSQKVSGRYFGLNVEVTEIFLQLSEYIGSHIFMEKILHFIEYALFGKEFSGSWEKQIILLLPFIPRLVFRVSSNWKYRLLRAFTDVFNGSKPDSALKFACLSSIKGMLLPAQYQDEVLREACIHDFIEFEVMWITELPRLLLQLGEDHPSYSEAVLRLLLGIGQFALPEYENIQVTFMDFFFRHENEKGISYGPFLKLPRECQELAICCLWYFSSLQRAMVVSLTHCCLSDDLDPYILFRVIETLQNAYKAGHVKIEDQISFLISLSVRFKVVPENVDCFLKGEKMSKQRTYRTMILQVCSCFGQMGDTTLILRMLENLIWKEMSMKPALENVCGILRIVVMLDMKPSTLTKEAIISLGSSLSYYMMSVASHIFEIDINKDSEQMNLCQYYFWPCCILFRRYGNLLSLVLNFMAASIMDCHSTDASHHVSDRVLQNSYNVFVASYILRFLYKDVKLQPYLLSCKGDIKQILQNIFNLQTSNEREMDLEAAFKVQCALDQLKIETSRLHIFDASDLERFS